MNKEQKLDNLKKQMSKADLPLKKGATNLVFGDGDPDADVLFIGEGPGYWEDMKGVPFVGNAGGLLNFSLKQIDLTRSSVYITNIVHYRPPSNRDPLPEEIEAFKPFLDKIIDIIDPKLVVTLGRYSMAKFIPGVTISNVHGKLHELGREGKKILVLPMYHPAAALRNGNVKSLFLQDFAKIPEILSKIKEKELEQKNSTEQMKLV
jgi:uracil-DNA glycosylase